jgi:hypothetical protein
MTDTLATKQALSEIDARMDMRFVHLDVRFGQVDARFDRIEAPFD